MSRRAIQKINAVEGIDHNGSIQKMLEDFDRRSLSPDERRVAVRAQFTKLTK